MDIYKTEDLALASYLVALGFDCQDVIPGQDKKKLYFVFPFVENLPTAVTMFGNGTAVINPLIYYKSIRALKTLIYEFTKK